MAMEQMGILPEMAQGLGLDLNPLIDNLSGRLHVGVTLGDINIKLNLHIRQLSQLLQKVMAAQGDAGSDDS